MFLLLTPIITGAFCSSKGAAKTEVLPSAKTSNKEIRSEEYVPKVEEPAAKLQELPIETVEGIGTVFGAKLRKGGIATVEDLLTSGTIQVARICGVSEDMASKWQAMSRFCWLEGISEEDSEAIVNVGIKNYRDLADAEPDVLLAKVTQAVADGAVEIPKGYEFTLEKVQKWIEVVTTFINEWQRPE